MNNNVARVPTSVPVQASPLVALAGERKKYSFADEIFANLALMQKTIDEGRGEDIDIGFIKIFENDIASLQGKEALDKIEELTLHLQGSAEMMRHEQLPRVRKPASFQDFIAPEGKPMPQDKGFRALDEAGFSYMRIRGDGHCLFRSLATGLLVHAAPIFNRPENGERRQVLGFIRTLVRDYPRLSEVAVPVMNMFEDLFARRLQLEEAITSRKTSDAMVAFLRALACEYNRAHGDEVFQSYVEERYGGPREDYLRDMADMKKRLSGDQPELIALAKALDLPITVLEVNGRGEVVTTLPSPEQHQGGRNPFYLSLNHGHYNFVIGDKGAEIPAPEPARAPNSSCEIEPAPIEPVVSGAVNPAARGINNTQEEKAPAAALVAAVAPNVPEAQPRAEHEEAPRIQLPRRKMPIVAHTICLRARPGGYNLRPRKK